MEDSTHDIRNATMILGWICRHLERNIDDLLFDPAEKLLDMKKQVIRIQRAFENRSNIKG